MTQRSGLVQCIVVIYFIAFPTYLITSAALTIENARIVDPMIGSPQFVSFNGSFDITVLTGGLFADHWNISLISVEYSWIDPYNIDLLEITGPLEGIYKLSVQIPPPNTIGVIRYSNQRADSGNGKTTRRTAFSLSL